MNEQQTMFQGNAYAPLASRVRPHDFDGYFGQQHLVGKGKILRQLIESDNVPSMIFWGPPGVGKTTLARIIAEQTKANFVDFSAVSSGIKEIREVMKQAEQNRFIGQKTILFIDEIHRFNKAQQDAFLPYVEKGVIVLIGATTENPSFEVNSALLSRCKVFVLQPLTIDDISELIRSAVHFLDAESDYTIELDDRVVGIIANFANGDARAALNTLEMIVSNSEIADGKLIVTDELVEQSISRKLLLYDKTGEEHYNIISALHKSMRNSDVQA
ncbi:MAG: AAA family ATPase, partial [Clostridiales Family XIII bacterium]|nr:AAA family ATPase [Clostridiales Family XIII bacterium]